MTAEAPGPASSAACGEASFAGVRARRAVECVRLDGPSPAALTSGFWAVVGEFDGPVRAWRFADVQRRATRRAAGAPDDGGPLTAPSERDGWRGPPHDAWTSSLDRAGYRAGVEEVRRRIRAGDVYQVNVCRVLSAGLPGGGPVAEPDAAALGARLAAGNPAPYGGHVHVPTGGPVPGVWVVTASPELYLQVADGVVRSGPIKGTAATSEGLTDKDRAENVMIADLVRNDLQRACRPGTVEVEHLLEVQHHPGLVHLVTTVRGRLRGPVDWAGLLAATYPPASVSGAPKHTALRAIRDVEPVRRGPYCGVVGWVDADAGRAELAVGIRTFWWTPAAGGTLRFGTGAGITWESVAEAEWAETELKAARLVGLASEGHGEGWT